jgi:hypothetical protein
LEAFVDWIAWDSPTPSGLGDYLDERTRLIRRLRGKAAEVFPEDTDWDREYIVPLFLVAFGLLRFAPQLGNQQAAVQFVLALTRYIARALRSWAGELIRGTGSGGAENGIGGNRDAPE